MALALSTLHDFAITTITNYHLLGPETTIIYFSFLRLEVLLGVFFFLRSLSLVSLFVLTWTPHLPLPDVFCLWVHTSSEKDTITWSMEHDKESILI